MCLREREREREGERERATACQTSYLKEKEIVSIKLVFELAAIIMPM